ncbi:hypothetical protein GCM10022384_31490 [Streptomyces marokkonensis]|uniref:mitogen-activated protein kinase kinase n=1 Tax=Streptomyces marokkonensis TaxID=324855 RepID=A0ABP7QCH5_9ACTN
MHYEDRLWLIMELVEGPSLAEHTATHGSLPVKRVAEIGLELLDALNAVHSVGALHRDVKPANVLLRADGRVVLCDFGIVELADTEALTTAGGVIGTVEYLSPERMEGRRAGPPSDLFSVGSTLCALLTGRSPGRSLPRWCTPWSTSRLCCPRRPGYCARSSPGCCARTRPRGRPPPRRDRHRAAAGGRDARDPCSAGSAHRGR